MQIAVLCAASAFIATVAAYPWGTSSCGPPGHGSGASADITGLTIKMDGSKVVLSSTRGSFKGFYVKSDQNLAWTDTPSGVCTCQCQRASASTSVIILFALKF